MKKHRRNRILEVDQVNFFGVFYWLHSLRNTQTSLAWIDELAFIYTPKA